MTDPITWTNERRKIRDLIPWPRNPRQIKGEQVRRLQESVEEFGQFETIAVGPGNEVYNGHQRLKSWGAKFGPDYEVEVRVASRELTEKEREKLTILAHKGAAGEWDFDTLANEFELADLVEWGFKEYELGIPGEVDNPEDEWEGMPEFKQEDKMGVQSIHVHFRNFADVHNFAELIGQSLTEKTRAIWFPEAEKTDMKSELYRDES